MIIISARKFRDSQNEILKKALSEEVILTTLHFGNFRLVPIVENKTEESEAEPVKKKTRTSGSKGKAIVHQQPPISGKALESMVDTGNLAAAESLTAAGSQAAAAKGTTAAKKSAVRDENNLLFPDLFASIETEPNPDRDAISGSASESPDPKIKARSRKSDPSRRRGKALPSSFGASRSDTDTPVMSNIPQWASGSDAASVSRKPEAPALAELVVDPDASSPTAVSGANGHPASEANHAAAAASAHSQAASASEAHPAAAVASAHSQADSASEAHHAYADAPGFEGGEGDYSDRFDDNGNPRLVSAGKHARDTREDPMSEEERVAAFERLRERARQVRAGASQKSAASESPAASAAHPEHSAARPAAARLPEATESSAHPENLTSDGEPKATAPAEPKASEANVYVDPSLMSLDEYYKQAGIELEPQKKGGFFSKIFGKK